jgi:hypothetical protein
VTLQINTISEPSDFTILIRDMQGREIFRRTNAQFTGNNRTEVDISRLKQGVYQLFIYNKSQEMFGKILKIDE